MGYVDRLLPYRVQNSATESHHRCDAQTDALIIDRKYLDTSESLRICAPDKSDIRLVMDRRAS